MAKDFAEQFNDRLAYHAAKALGVMVDNKHHPAKETKAEEKKVTAQTYLEKNDPLYKPIMRQEKLINESLHLGLDDKALEQRASLAKYAFDIHSSVFKDQPLLFDAEVEEITPVNSLKKINEMIDRCHEISEMATCAAPQCTYDLLTVFFKELEPFLLLQDQVLNQNFVLILRIVAEAKERNDLVAISDIFYGEVQALLKNMANRIQNSGAVRLA